MGEVSEDIKDAAARAAWFLKLRDPNDSIAMQQRRKYMTTSEPPTDVVALAETNIAGIMAYEPQEMPPVVDDIAFMIETIAFRYGQTSRADVWRLIGIKPERGRALLTRNHNAFDWPIFFTMREAAFGKSR